MTTRPYLRGSLVERFWAKVDVRGAGECWPWKAGSSRSGRREVNYGNVKEGPKGSRCWRANRLALLLKTAPAECPRDDDEPLIDWLRRANRAFAHMDASHTCDVSLCCNPEHLEWKSHAENIAEQKERQRLKRLAAA